MSTTTTPKPQSAPSVKDNAYWNSYYAANDVPAIPSNFAQSILPSIDKSSALVELGCGNGRDSFFFARNGITTIAVDLSAEAIERNNSFGHDNVQFRVADFTAMDEDEFAKENVDVGNIYSRFTLHSVDRTSYGRTLDWCAAALKEKVGGKLFLEARTVHDPLCGTGTKGEEEGEWSTTHYRRFAKIKDVMDDLTKRGFGLLHVSENYTDSWYKDDHAVVYRITAEKK
mmetsp:Transcript_23140/g.28386  ORF Transcript_23140/g.28386 Transcript_23140/m.28386 type:complete len:228 (-) Transcript_23140:156-839(-)